MFFYDVTKESFQLFSHLKNENQHQLTYKLEEISREHYAKELFFSDSTYIHM